ATQKKSKKAISFIIHLSVNSLLQSSRSGSAHRPTLASICGTCDFRRLFGSFITTWTLIVLLLISQKFIVYRQAVTAQTISSTYLSIYASETPNRIHHRLS